MASCEGAAAAESNAEEMTCDGEWVEVELDPDWVFVNPENHEDAREGPDHNSGNGAPDPAPANLQDQDVHKEEPGVSGDGSEAHRIQNDRETNKERDVDEGPYGFFARDESALGFPPDAFENDAYSGVHGFSEGACEDGGSPRLSDDALVYGCFKGTCKEEKDEGKRRVSDWESARGFLEAGPCEDDDKIAHGFSHERGFFEGECEEDDDEDAHGISDAESARGFCEDARKEEEEEEEDNDEYSDALHEGALQEEVNKDTKSLMDAMERFYMNPVRECSQEYICSLQTETRSDDELVAHGFPHESGFSEAACEDDADGEDAHGLSDAEHAHGFSEDSCKTAAAEEEEEEVEEEEEEENDEYSDAMYEGAIQDEVNKCTNSVMDAVERYYTNPARECWQEYICSVHTETRRELHKEKMASFWGHGPEPEAFIKGTKCFNPLFEEMWLPWAINAEYCHNEDMGLLVCDGATGWTQRMLAQQRYTSSAVPILPVLEFMVEHAPGKKIAHVGSCSSLYWAALLQGLGATNVVVTEGICPVTWAPAGYPHIEQIGEEMFFMLDMAVGQALFFLRPPKRSSDAEPCMAERCLFCFPGDTIFFVGESGECANNFDMAQWVEEHQFEGWHVEKDMEIPCWPGSHDVFLCITKASLPVDNTTQGRLCAELA